MYFQLKKNRIFGGGRLLPASSDPVIVFLHGAAMDHTVWTYYVRYFVGAGYSVLAPDLPGHGRSGGTPLRTIRDMADWVEEAMDELEIGSIALAGHSMGALISLEFASRYAQKVKRLALLGVSCPMPVSEQLLDEARKDSPVARDMMMIWGHGHRSLLGGNPVPGANIFQSGLRLLERAKPGILHTDLKACNGYGSGFESAVRITCRTHLICGREDRMTPSRGAEKLATLIPNSEVQVIDESGHMMMSEQPEKTHSLLLRALI